MNKKILRIVLALVVNIAVIAVAPVSAKNLNLPPGAEGITYLFGGDSVSVDLPTPLPTNYPPNAIKIGFMFAHVVIPNAGIDSRVLTVQFYLEPPGSPPAWMPWAQIITSAEDADFQKMWWSGTWVQLNATLYGLPEIFNTDNVIVVSEDDLQVEKHGNRAYVSLNTPQEIDTWVEPLVPAHFTVYPFSFELSKYGGSVHRNSTISMVGFPGASNYTMVIEEMGFYANGVFTCEEWDYFEVAVNDAFIAMHKTLTHYPPT